MRNDPKAIDQVRCSSSPLRFFLAMSVECIWALWVSISQHISSKYMPAGTVWTALYGSFSCVAAGHLEHPRIERNKLVALITIEVHARDVQDRMIVPFGSKQMNFDHMTGFYQRSSMIELRPCLVSKLRFCPFCPLKFPLRTSKQSRPATSTGPHSCGLNCERARRS